MADEYRFFWLESACEHMWKIQRHFCLVNVSLNMFEPYTSTPFHTIFLITYGNGGTYWEWEPRVDKESISFLYDAALMVPGAFLTTATPMNSDASGQPLLGNKVQRILRSINCAKHEKVGYAMPSQQESTSGPEWPKPRPLQVQSTCRRLRHHQAIQFSLREHCLNGRVRRAACGMDYVKAKALHIFFEPNTAGTHLLSKLQHEGRILGKG